MIRRRVIPHNANCRVGIIINLEATTVQQHENRSTTVDTPPGPVQTIMIKLHNVRRRSPPTTPDGRSCEHILATPAIVYRSPSKLPADRLMTGLRCPVTDCWHVEIWPDLVCSRLKSATTNAQLFPIHSPTLISPYNLLLKPVCTLCIGLGLTEVLGALKGPYY